ncbi:hypothetical protein L596_023175 [Steinernema carpocapsae]|uniref:Uncharacterized protein n=1 Tax=Steinernema carpocapsae TaxID=34508 RepID=A0A4V5ZZB6_STECR|nr:hypothetical protein L596_023175 [Steinernema carpocapsae]
MNGSLPEPHCRSNRGYAFRIQVSKPAAIMLKVSAVLFCAIALNAFYFFILAEAAPSSKTLEDAQNIENSKNSPNEIQTISEMLHELTPKQAPTEITYTQEQIEKYRLQRPTDCQAFGKILTTAFHCPTPAIGPDGNLQWRCVRFNDLCDERIDCPNAEDEDPKFCMFQKLNGREIRELRQFAKNIDHRLFPGPADLIPQPIR